MGFAAALPLLLTAASAGVGYYNTKKTASKQDSALADQLRNQGEVQRRASGKVNEEVDRLKGSTSDDSRRKALDSYLTALVQRKGKSESGLTPTFGSDAFKADSATAAQGVQAYGDDTAGLMARIDAPTTQRRKEAFSFGNLGTDLSLLDREAKGKNFLDELRLRSIHRSPGLDWQWREGHAR